MVRTLYLAMVGQKWVSPAEFWALAPGEVWWIVEANTPDTSGYEQAYQNLKALQAEQGELDG